MSTLSLNEAIDECWNSANREKLNYKECGDCRSITVSVSMVFNNGKRDTVIEYTKTRDVFSL